MLCIWWDYELQEMNETINTERYCKQLGNLKAAIQEKSPSITNRHGVVFHQDNARQHVSVKFLQILKGFGWDVLNHPPYSPDMAPSDFHLFRSLQHFLLGKRLTFVSDVLNNLDKFFEAKSEEFYRRGIEKLYERWEQIIKNNGQYIIN